MPLTLLLPAGESAIGCLLLSDLDMSAAGSSQEHDAATLESVVVVK